MRTRPILPLLIVALASAEARAQQPPNLAPRRIRTIEVNPSVFKDVLPRGTDISSYVLGAATVWSDDARRAAVPQLTASYPNGQSSRLECDNTSSVLVRATTRKLLIGNIFGISLPCISGGNVVVVLMNPTHIPIPTVVTDDATATLIHELGHAWGQPHSGEPVNGRFPPVNGCLLMANGGFQGLGGTDRVLCTNEIDATTWSPVNATIPVSKRFSCATHEFLGDQPTPISHPGASWGGATHRTIDGSGTRLMATGFTHYWEIGTMLESGFGVFQTPGGTRRPFALGQAFQGPGIAAAWDESCCQFGTQKVWTASAPNSFSFHGAPEAAGTMNRAVSRAPVVSATSTRLVAVHSQNVFGLPLRVSSKPISAPPTDGWQVHVIGNINSFGFGQPSIACNETTCVVAQTGNLSNSVSLAKFDITPGGAISNVQLSSLAGSFVGATEVVWLECASQFALVRRDAEGQVFMAVASSLSSSGWSSFSQLGSVVNGTDFRAFVRSPYVYSSGSEIIADGY